jgi:HemY protein
MAKFVLFLILLVPLVACGNWLLAHPGLITLDWLGYSVTLHIALAALLFTLCCLLVAALAMLCWQIATWPERRRARRRFRTLARGLRQLTHGVTSLALGDEKAAQKALARASALLPGEPLPQLLTAQLLQRQGQHEAARKELRSLMKHEATAQLATHRLIEQHLADRDWAQAVALAEQVKQESPRDRWLILTLIDLYSRLGDSAQVLKLTEGWQFQSPLSKEERHRYAALAYLQSARGKTDGKARLTTLRHAVGYAPDLLPAVIAYSEQLLAQGERKPARRLLRDAWLRQPDPLLIPLILSAIADETPRAQTRMLAAFLPAEREAPHYLLEARHALAQDRPAEAEDHLERALRLEESKEACLLMAQLQKRLHGDDAANRWLERAARAPAGISWICQGCGHAHGEWQPHCEGCDAFDTLRHETPEARLTSVEA